MSETITTPGGLVLLQRSKDRWTADGAWRVELIRDPFVDAPGQDRWDASFGGEDEDRYGTLAECLAWLDARRSEALSALLPQNARQIVAQYLAESGGMIGPGGTTSARILRDAVFSDMKPDTQAAMLAFADDLLSRLGTGRKACATT